MRVLLVTETGEIGGAEINLLTIATELHDRGWEVAAVVPAEGPLTRRLRQAGVPVVVVARLPFLSTSLEFRSNRKIPNFFSLPINALVGLLWAVKLYAIFHQRRPCIVHTVSMWTHVFAGLAGRLAGCRVVWHFQGIVNPKAGLGLYRRLVRWWGKYIPDRIVCLSTLIAHQFGGHRLLDKKTTVIWPVVDLEKFQPPHRDFHSRSNNDVIVIGTVARLTPWKGQQVALEAVRILKDQGFRFKWLFVGDAALGSLGYQTLLHDLVEQWNILDCVEFTGWVENIAMFYRGLDLFVHIPLEPEPFGMVLIEAMATGLPIITTAGGGAEEMIEPAGGLLVPPGQPRSVVVAMRAICASPQELLRRSKMARSFAERMFSIDQYMDRWLSVYRSL